MDCAHPEQVRDGDAKAPLESDLGDDTLRVMCTIDMAETDIDKEFTLLGALKI